MKVEPLNNMTYEPLLDTESSLMYFLAEPAVTSISFFKGSSIDYQKSLSKLKQRIMLICQANPWLTARLVRDKKRHKNVMLAIPQTVTDDDVTAVMFSDKDDLCASPLSSINLTTDYETLSSAVMKSPAVVKPGYQLVGKDTRISKFALIPSESQVIFILSITHAVVDGYTYYRIMTMLSENEPIIPLSSHRKHKSLPLMNKAIGEKEMQFMTSPGLTLGMIRAMLCRPSKVVAEARFVDEDKIKKIKNDVDRRVPGDQKNQGEFSFSCSTNDIITSTFGLATRAELLLMAINLRNRLTKLTTTTTAETSQQQPDDHDAGNYESVVLYDAPSLSKPELIRQSLRRGPPFVRVGGSPDGLPGFFKQTRLRFAMITNWAFPSFKANLRLVGSSGTTAGENGEAADDCGGGGGGGVPLTLHLPIYSTKVVVFPVAIVFRACEGRLAVLYLGGVKDLSYEKLVESGAPIGDCVNDVMFGG